MTYKLFFGNSESNRFIELLIVDCYLVKKKYNKKRELGVDRMKRIAVILLLLSISIIAGCTSTQMSVYEKVSENHTEVTVPVFVDEIKTTVKSDNQTNVSAEIIVTSEDARASMDEKEQNNLSGIYVKDIGSALYGVSSTRSSANSELVLIGEPKLGEPVIFRLTGGWMSVENNYYSATQVNATYYFNFSESPYYETYKLFEDPNCCIITSGSPVGEEILIGNQIIAGEINVTINKTGFFKVAGTVLLSWKTETNTTRAALWTDFLFFNVTENSYVVSRTLLYNETPDPCGPPSKVYIIDENESVIDIREVQFCSTGPPTNSYMQKNIMEKQELPDNLKEEAINASRRNYDLFKKSFEYQLLFNTTDNLSEPEEVNNSLVGEVAR